MIKTCKKCNQDLDLSEFYERKLSKDGHRHACKDCLNEEHRKRYLSKREIRLQQYKDWRDKRGGKKVLQKYYKDNLSKFKERGKQYYQGNKRDFREKVWKHIGIVKSDGSFFTSDDFDKEFLKHDGKCWICEKPEATKRFRLNVDHDHTTGLYRGLLCSFCNHGLGRFRDDINSLERAIIYLKRSRSDGNVE